MIVGVTMDNGDSRRYVVDSFYVDDQGYVVLVDESERIVGQVAPGWKEVVDIAASGVRP